MSEKEFVPIPDFPKHKRRPGMYTEKVMRALHTDNAYRVKVEEANFSALRATVSRIAKQEGLRGRVLKNEDGYVYAFFEGKGED